MEEINIKDFFIYLKRYILAFIILIALSVTAVIVYDVKFKQPIYQAKTTVVIAKSSDKDNATSTLNDVNTSQKLTTTYSEIAKSELVLNKVIKSLDLPVNAKTLSSNVAIKPIEDTSILSISVNDPDPLQAKEIANKIATVFINEITKIYQLDNVSQLSIASVPEAPANDTLNRDIVLAAAVAIMVVGGFAFLRFYLDDTVKYGDDTEKILSLPIAGKVSKATFNKKQNPSELLVANAPKSIVSENVKSLRTNLQFTTVDNHLKTILITSVNASEGKSFVSSNLAISFAQADKNVLLVDCDLRKGRLHKIFGISNRSGYSNLLTDNLSNFKSYIFRSNIKNLSVLTCGSYPPNPSELLASRKNKKLINILKNNYDIIIFDGAPIDGLADSTIVSSLVDKTLIVVKNGKTTKASLIATKDSLKKVGANIAGLVFNSVKNNNKKYKYYSESE